MVFDGKPWLLSGIAATVLGLALAAPTGAVDEDAARTLAKQSGCFKCHAVDKKKDGPAWNTVAEKHKDLSPADLEARVTQHLTSGEKVKFEDGHEEEHKIVKSDDPVQIKNLVDWIISLKK